MSQDNAADAADETNRVPNAASGLDALSTLIFKARVTARDEPEDSQDRVDVNVSHFMAKGDYSRAAHFCYATVMAGRKFTAPHDAYETATAFFDERQP